MEPHSTTFKKVSEIFVNALLGKDDFRVVYILLQLGISLTLDYDLIFINLEVIHCSSWGYWFERFSSVISYKNAMLVWGFD